MLLDMEVVFQLEAVLEEDMEGKEDFKLARNSK